MKPDDVPDDVWEKAYDLADGYSDLYGCDSVKRQQMGEDFAHAILGARSEERDRIETFVEDMFRDNFTPNRSPLSVLKNVLDHIRSRQ